MLRDDLAHVDALLTPLAAEAVDRLHRDGASPPACSHLALHGLTRPGGPVVTVCASHPDRLRCIDCGMHHARRHGVELEHTCDGCDRVTERMYGAAVPALVIVAPRVARQVRVIGLGLCVACVEEVDRG